MFQLVFTCVLLSFVGVSFGDHHDRPGKYLAHDRTVVNCAKYKREANQHSCVLSAFNTEGPYFLPDDLERSNLADDQIGIPFNLTIQLVNSNDCNPLSNMYVHIWHANAMGMYSGVDNGDQTGEGSKNLDKLDHGGPGNPGFLRGRPTPINKSRFGRGYQVTDANGQVHFKTIMPGWYTGRCLHVHVEVYPQDTTSGSDLLYVGQLFFHRELPYELKLVDPYSQNNQFLVLNENDGIYINHGNETVLDLIAHGNSFKTSITLGINPDTLK
ncbi:uncharacterized protein LOC128394537 [Panonychus citri]|uniref:uncharacterized protein LOC128394537 n=1 Tax=Panonychus citri TaxID=50023 RepID=UPI0023075852|nr:uncharacterized protein LOC128394537 [Panonychus citri]